MRRFNSISGRAVLKVVAACSVTSAFIVGSAGCDVKSFIDPSELGRYDHQPLVLNILHKLDTGIDEPNDAYANATDPLPEDLVYTAQAYIIGPGDTLSVNVSDLAANGQQSGMTLKVSDAGTLNLPLLSDEMKVVGLTETQLQKAIQQAYRDAKLFLNTNVTVTVVESRARTFSLYNFPNPGEFPITKKDFRLLDAFNTGRFTNIQGVDYLYIMRQDEVQASEVPPGSPSSMPSTAPAGPTTSPGPDILAPRASRIDLLTPRYLQVPANPIVPPAPGTPTPPGSPPNPATPQAQGTPQTPGTPPIPGIAPPPPATPNTPPPGAATQPGGYEGRYIIIDGKPVLVGGTSGTAAPMGNGMSPITPTAVPPGSTTMPTTGHASSQPFTFQDLTPPTGQRVIRVPLAQLRNLDLRYNLVVHPGDKIFLPDPQVGYYYMGGHVARTGAYTVGGGGVTLMQAIIAAGMLDQVAIPQRTDIIRRIGSDKYVFARVNLEDIFEGKQPDIFIKPNDQVMVGTNILAPFIAAVRNGFRFSYGFGFFYDKNFNDDNNNNNSGL